MCWPRQARNPGRPYHEGRQFKRPQGSPPEQSIDDFRAGVPREGSRDAGMLNEGKNRRAISFPPSPGLLGSVGATYDDDSSNLYGSQRTGRVSDRQSNPCA